MKLGLSIGLAFIAGTLRGICLSRPTKVKAQAYQRLRVTPVEPLIDGGYVANVQREDLGFSCTQNGGRLTVVRHVPSVQEIPFNPRRVDVELRDEKIYISGTESSHATVAISKTRECILKGGAEELSFWQFRMKALHDLFFSLQF